MLLDRDVLSSGVRERVKERPWETVGVPVHVGESDRVTSLVLGDSDAERVVSPDIVALNVKVGVADSEMVLDFEEDGSSEGVMEGELDISCDCVSVVVGLSEAVDSSLLVGVSVSVFTV
jgi:hypothetical protein